MDREKKKFQVHPVWFFLVLIVITVVLSALLSLFNFQGTQTDVSLGSSSTSVLTVKSLLSYEGIKYMFSESINNFLKFVPLGTLIVGLLGVGLMIKTGLLKSLFSKLNKIIPRKTMFFIFSLLCIIMGFSTDLSFVIMIPIAAILFTEYKRSQVVGMTMAFASVAAGANINIFITSIDYSLIELAKSSVNMVDPNYIYGYSGNLFFVVISSLLLALLISIMTEIIARRKPVRIGSEEIELNEKLDKKAFKKALIAFIIMFVLLVYAIIPKLPLSGALLDSSQSMYVNKLFGANSPFVNGILWKFVFFSGYGFLNKILIGLGLVSKPVQFLGSRWLLLLVVSIVVVWRSVPFMALVCLAGRQSIPDAIYEAAKMDGGTPRKVFWHITMPLMKPFLALGITSTSVTAINVFDEIVALSGYGDLGKNILMESYLTTFSFLNFGKGSAMTYIVLFFALLLGIFYLRNLNKEVDY